MITAREIQEHIVMAKLSGKKLIFHDSERQRDLEYIKITSTDNVMVRFNRPWFTESPVAYQFKNYSQLTSFELSLK